MNRPRIDLTTRPLGHLLLRVGQIADREGIPVYVVGGSVRDWILDRRADTDVDLVCVGSGSGIQLARAVAAEFDAPPATVFPSFGTASVRITSFPAIHVLDGSVSFRLDWKGLSFVFGGDSVPNKWFITTPHS